MDEILFARKQGKHTSSRKLYVNTSNPHQKKTSNIKSMQEWQTIKNKLYLTFRSWISATGICGRGRPWPTRHKRAILTIEVWKVIYVMDLDREKWLNCTVTCMSDYRRVWVGNRIYWILINVTTMRTMLLLIHKHTHYSSLQHAVRFVCLFFQ
jgi:hypothetical protein